MLSMQFTIYLNTYLTVIIESNTVGGQAFNIWSGEGIVISSRVIIAVISDVCHSHIVHHLGIKSMNTLLRNRIGKEKWRDDNYEYNVGSISSL